MAYFCQLLYLKCCALFEDALNSPIVRNISSDLKKKSILMI